MWTVHVTWAVTLMMTSVYAAEPFLKLSEGCSRMGGSINCSYRQLYQVPNDLPASAVSLNLSHNLLSNLSDDVFHHLTSLTVLDLSYNYLSSFTPSVFWASTTCSGLVVIYGWAEGDEVRSWIRTFAELEKTSLLGSQDGFCDIEILYNDTFKHHPPALEYLNLSYCNIRFIEADAFSPLRTLQILDLSHNEDLGFQRLGLAVYGLQGSALHTLYINHINHPYDTCVQISSIDTTHFKNTSITSIYAKHNSLQFFSPGALLNMPDSLQFVCLDGNHLRFGRYLQDLNKLKRLKIIHNDGYNHPPKTPTHYPVARTMYDDVDKRHINISSSKSLRLIDLAYNNINSLPNDMRSHLDTVAQATSETVIINLTYNHIICMCQNIEFLSWMQNTKVHFPNVTKYSCLMSDGSVKSSINIFEVIADLQKECSSYIGIIVGTVCCCCCLLVAVVSALMYRFRWKLRYWYYASRMSYRGIQSQEARQFDYDAFVSYASDDEDFVRSQLVHNLEVQENLRLNVHYRDFMPAQPIPCNIVAAVESSRRTLVVLTRHLLQSDWCQYEMQMATMEAVHTGRDVLVFLLYEDIPSHELPRHVLYNLQSSTYIRFPGEDTMLPTFWSRLAHAIRM
ncbi:hypothetical protein C0Q70_01079 [Pomacea canaliculata]|uniref:TIR domain-containing protein n=1 Tax=Pomacea canaliculata TaxID=400727 RepID=A0A2T7PYG6_POMCA|nr:hypothetical protein C0Q70_01079 [Pomacea canaliculata]